MQITINETHGRIKYNELTNHIKNTRTYYYETHNMLKHTEIGKTKHGYINGKTQRIKTICEIQNYDNQKRKTRKRTHAITPTN